MLEQMFLKHTTAIISGGASGLGAAAAKYIVNNGGRAIVGDLGHQLDAFHDSVMELKGFQEGRMKLCTMDVTKEEQIELALDEAANSFGEEINTCVACAGVAPGRKILSKSKNTSAEMRVHSLDEFSNTLQVNATGAFNLARLSAARIASRPIVNQAVNETRGVIVLTASIAAFEGQVGQIAYSASKGAVVGMILPMARDLASFNIRVMGIAPGLFRTPLMEGLPLKVQQELGASVPFPSRLGNPEEFAQLVGHIIQNNMLNGEVIRLDGALRMPP